MAISNEQINLYWRQNYRSAARKKADEIRAALIVHSQKVKPESILKRNRPNENAEHLSYRLQNYEPTTYGSFYKVLTQFSKIRRSEEWGINYSDQIANNILKEYCEKNLPKYDSVSNWLFNFQLARIIDDPNGAIMIMPRNFDYQLLDLQKLNQTEPFKPYPFYIPCTQINELTEEIFVYEVQQGVRLADGTLDATELRRTMYLVDKEEIVKVKYKTSRTDEGETVRRYKFNCESMPVFPGGGFILEDDTNGNPGKLYDSFLGPAVPYWNEAIEGESDHKVDKVLHLHPDRFEYASKKCGKCENGQVKLSRNRGFRNCGDCGGTGLVTNKTPFGVLKVNFEKTGPNMGNMPPMPPAGYILRPIESIKLTKELADQKIYDGLDALNLAFIATSPLNQSGTAKEYDRQEPAAYMTTVATHLVENVMRPTYYYLNFWLSYGVAETERLKLEPQINIPRKFDLITADVWQARVAALVEGGNNKNARARAEIKLAEKQYGPESVDYFAIRDGIILDPLYGMNTDEKATTLMNNGCTQNDFIISNQIGFFIRQAAMETKDKFFELPMPEKIKKLNEYAEAVRQAAPAMSLPNPENKNPLA